MENFTVNNVNSINTNNNLNNNNNNIYRNEDIFAATLLGSFNLQNFAEPNGSHTMTAPGTLDLINLTSGTLMY